MYTAIPTATCVVRCYEVSLSSDEYRYYETLQYMRGMPSLEGSISRIRNIESAVVIRNAVCFRFHDRTDMEVLLALDDVRRVMTEYFKDLNK